MRSKNVLGVDGVEEKQESGNRGRGHKQTMGGIYYPPTRQIIIESTPATVKQVDQQNDPEASTIMEQPMDTDCEQKRDTAEDHPTTNTGKHRRTKEERMSWRVSEGLPAQKTRREQRLRKQLRQRKLKTEENEPPTSGISPEQTKLSDTPQPSPTVFPEPFGEPDMHWSTIWSVDAAAGNSDAHPGVEQPLLAAEPNTSIFTRKTNPFKAERVDAVLNAVSIGEDLTAEQRAQVTKLLQDHADCFALSINEVTVVEGAQHRLNIPNRETTKF
ncbi:hypothetical protein DXG01_001187 [Tephrocybe rancida]|nr:hypothetical protein DXG01_001187 [Tephrocybe rancida]